MAGFFLIATLAAVVGECALATGAQRRLLVAAGVIIASPSVRRAWRSSSPSSASPFSRSIRIERPPCAFRVAHAAVRRHPGSQPRARSRRAKCNGLACGARAMRGTRRLSTPAARLSDYLEPLTRMEHGRRHGPRRSAAVTCAFGPKIARVGALWIRARAGAARIHPVRDGEPVFVPAGDRLRAPLRGHRRDGRGAVLARGPRRVARVRRAGDRRVMQVVRLPDDQQDGSPFSATGSGACSTMM